ncbi:MAG: chemotaxis response regulator protein-glutamate methylesterase [Spirochaetes bacterium GWF1_51_8]|nr:MAG: chemotaxis response regulator protein-glutamate methylesterase [Spirochaetes bacterium GWF1_51_8]
MSKIRVFLVDDSASIRQTLEMILSQDPEIEVIGSAPDPYFAAEKFKEVLPDVIILDIEMPRMDGLTFMEKIMSQRPIPIVICSSLTDSGSQTALRALELGASDIITKPKLGTKVFLEESRIRITDAVKAAVKGNPKRINFFPKIEPKLSADVMLGKLKNPPVMELTDKVIVIGASTGGTEALRVFLQAVPATLPGIVIVQHMPEGFTNSFAKRLDELCEVSVKEAENGDMILRGHVLIAPGNKHTLLKRSGARYLIEVRDGPLVNRHRPSVDVLFRSAARYAGQNAVGIIMTGMGDDGAKGLSEMREAGAFTFAEDEQSCVVFGMPKAAIELGAAMRVLPLDKIAADVVSKYNKM